MFSLLFIREQDPLKQGLKLGLVGSSRAGTTNSRARSIKTRIETVVVGVDPAATSKIREQDPLKQGLKRDY